MPTDGNGRFELHLPRYFDSLAPRAVLISIVNDDGAKVGAARHVPCPMLHLGEVSVLRLLHLVTLYMRGRNGVVRWANHYLQVRQASEGREASWVGGLSVFSEYLADGGVAYYSHDSSKHWRVVFGHPSLKGSDPGAFAEPVEFRAGQNPLEVTQTSRLQRGR